MGYARPATQEPRTRRGYSRVQRARRHCLGRRHLECQPQAFDVSAAIGIPLWASEHGGLSRPTARASDSYKVEGREGRLALGWH